MQGTPSPYPHPPQPGTAQPPGLPESFNQVPAGADIGLWPLAWGWWGLLILVVVMLVGLVMGIRAWRRHRLFLRMALKELQTLDPDETNVRHSCNQIIKRTFMSYFPVEKVAKLHGDGWSQFLKSQLSPKKQLRLTPLLNDLSSNIYRPENQVTTLPDGELIGSSMALLKHSLPPSKKQLAAAQTGGK